MAIDQRKLEENALKLLIYKLKEDGLHLGISGNSTKKAVERIKDVSNKTGINPTELLELALYVTEKAMTGYAKELTEEFKKTQTPTEPPACAD